MRKSYRELTEEIKTDGERLKLIAALGSSDDLAYHYALICEDWAAGGKLLLENSFDRHGEAGIVFLLERLRAFGTASKTDESAAAGTATDTAYLAAKILSQLRHRDFYAARAKELAALLTARWEISDIALRRKQIIALGWIGSEAEINLLIDSMQSDSDALCRAWAAAALMQLSFHGVAADVLRERTKAAFAAAIQKEGDLNAAGIMIEAAQTLFGKKWISAAAAEAAESESIEKARKSALRFLGKA